MQSEEEKFLTKITEIAGSKLSNEQFGVSELSREMGISRSNLHGKVKKLTGKSVSRFIRELRLQKALLMLKQTSLTSSEVAFKCGFHSVSYFNSCFRSYYGYSPGQAGKIDMEYHGSYSTLSRSTEPARRRKKPSIFLITGFSVIILASIFYILFKPFPSVFEDDFSQAHDYIADSVAGTIWDGYLLNSGMYYLQNSKLFNLNTIDIPGSLYIEASNTDWERDEDDGVFLFKIVDADKNFDMSVMIGPKSTFSSLDGEVQWNSGGLMVKHPEADSIDYLILLAFDMLNEDAVHLVLNVNGGQQIEILSRNADSIIANPWLRITRDGSIFTTYYGPDGVKWEEISSVNRLDLMDTPLLVGIAQATFSGRTTHVEYDNFSLKTSVPR